MGVQRGEPLCRLDGGPASAPGSAQVIESERPLGVEPSMAAVRAVAAEE